MSARTLPVSARNSARRPASNSPMSARTLPIWARNSARSSVARLSMRAPLASMRVPSELNCHIIRPTSAASSAVSRPPNRVMTNFSDNSCRSVTCSPPTPDALATAAEADPAVPPAPETGESAALAGSCCSAGAVMAAVVSTGEVIGPRCSSRRSTAHVRFLEGRRTSRATRQNPP